MAPDPSPPKPVKSDSIVIGLLLLGAVNAVVVGLLGLGTRALLRTGKNEPGLWVFLVFMWTGVVVVLVGPSIYKALVALRYGRSTLRLDAAPVRAGGFVSGVLEASEGLYGGDIAVFVECIRTHYRGRTQRHREWQSITLLDGAQLERESSRVFIPFCVQLPADGLSSSDDKVKQVRLEWFLRVEASRAGIDYDVQFGLDVQPKDETEAPAPSTPPRLMPELRPDQVAARLEAAFEPEGDARVMRLPFPVRLVFLTTLFGGIALGLAVPGLAWTTSLDPDLRWILAGASGALSAALLLALMFTGRAIEVRPASLVLRRGLFGLGFHKTVAAREIVAVEETVVSVEDSIGGFGVSVKLRDGSVHSAVKRLRDPAQARALVRALEAVLPKP